MAGKVEKLIDVKQFLALIINPTLGRLTGYHRNMDGPAASALLLGTALQESRLCFLTQLDDDDDPYDDAMGVFQMEAFTHDDTWTNFIEPRGKLDDLLQSMVGSMHRDIRGIPQAPALVHNLAYAAAMCRVHYWRVPASLPHPDDVHGMARYWKTYYNTKGGAGTEAEYVYNWKRYAGGLRG